MIVEIVKEILEPFPEIMHRPLFWAFVFLGNIAIRSQTSTPFPADAKTAFTAAAIISFVLIIGTAIVKVSDS